MACCWQAGLREGAMAGLGNPESSVYRATALARVPGAPVLNCWMGTSSQQLLSSGILLLQEN